MITNIYFVRHAQSDFNIKDDIIRPLTEKGLKDTRLVIESLADREITKVYSSPYKRAYDTIKGFAEEKGFDINIIDDFRERWVDDVWVEDFKEFSRRQWEDFNYKLEKGETLGEVQKRNVNALYDVLKENMGSNIAIGSHGTALCTIINYFNPAFGYDDFWKMVDKMPYIMCFKFENSEFIGMEEIEIL